MITGILLLSIVGFIAVVSYRRPKLEQRMFKNIPLIDWLNILLFPVMMYIGVALIVRNVLSRPRVEVMDFDPFLVIAVGVLALVYGFVGKSIHFVGKVMSRYVEPNKHALIYQVNEVFHGKLSHYMAHVSAMLVVFLVALLEVNYPLESPIPDVTARYIIAFSIIFGISATKSVFLTHNWFGGYNRPLFSLTFLLFFLLIGIVQAYNVDSFQYPILFFTIFFLSSMLVTFLTRGIVITTKTHARRWRAKMGFSPAEQKSQANPRTSSN